jgi:hypothetical protein
MFTSLPKTKQLPQRRQSHVVHNLFSLDLPAGDGEKNKKKFHSPQNHFSHSNDFTSAAKEEKLKTFCLS